MRKAPVDATMGDPPMRMSGRSLRVRSRNFEGGADATVVGRVIESDVEQRAAGGEQALLTFYFRCRTGRGRPATSDVAEGI